MSIAEVEELRDLDKTPTQNDVVVPAALSPENLTRRIHRVRGNSL